MCTIILILSWHYQIVNKSRVIFCFLQSAIEKLTHDYLNLFHFPPLIKVSKVFFLTENMLLLLTYTPATSTPRFANVGNCCLK